MSSMYVFTRKWGSPTVMFYWLCKTRIGAVALIHGQQTIYWVFTQTKLSSIYRNKLYCHLLGLDKASSVAYNSGEIQTCNYYYFFFLLFSLLSFFYSGEIFASVWPEEGNFEVLKRCYIQIYPTVFLLCNGNAVNLRSTYVKERVE